MKLKKTLLAGGAAFALLVGSQAAFATTTVAVNGTTSPAADVSVTGPSVGPISFVTDSAVPGSCLGGTSSGYVKRGASAVSGQKIGAIQSLTFNTGCVFLGALNFPVTITKKGTAVADEWGIYADGTPAKGATSMNVEIRNVRAAMRDSARTAPNFRCAVNFQGNVSGTLGATVKAKIQLNVVGTTDYLVVNTPALSSAFQFPLTLDALNGSADKAATGTTDSCGGEFVDGDKLSMIGSFAFDQQVAIN